MSDNRQEQLKGMAEKAQMLLLQTYLKRLEGGTITDTGLAALQKLLLEFGWEIDLSAPPEDLVNSLTTQIDPDELDAEDPDVIDLRERRAAW